MGLRASQGVNQLSCSMVWMCEYGYIANISRLAHLFFRNVDHDKLVGSTSTAKHKNMCYKEDRHVYQVVYLFDCESYHFDVILLFALDRRRLLITQDYLLKKRGKEVNASWHLWTIGFFVLLWTAEQKEMGRLRCKPWQQTNSMLLLRRTAVDTNMLLCWSSQVTALRKERRETNL